MREFSWRYFTLTGDIDAYLLYKRHERIESRPSQPDTDSAETDPDES